MVKVSYGPKFEEAIRKLKDNSLKERLYKQIEKIIRDPNFGKPMRHERKGTREIYVQPYRLAYNYYPEKNEILILDFYHKDKQ